MGGNELSIDARSLLLPDLPSGAPGTAKKTRKAKPKKPEPPAGSVEWWDRWLTRNMAPLRSNDKYDIWRCTSCGAPILYAKNSGRHGGPSHRMLDRRYGMTACWRVSEGGWKTASVAPHGRGASVLVRHDSRPQSEQPEQPSSATRHTGASPRSVASYGKVPGRVVYSTKTTGVGATVRAPCVEPAGSVAIVSPASTVADQITPSSTAPQP